MSKTNDGYDFQMIIAESQKNNVLYKVTMKMGKLESVFEDEGFLLDILQGFAGLLQEISQRDNSYVDPVNKLKIQVDLEKMGRVDNTIQYLLDEGIIQQAPKAFKLFFPNGIH